MGYNIISGMSQQFYHTIPSDMDLISTIPTREGIFRYLSQIGYDKFPEFILDILVKVERYKPVDVTDGQGDEKQDILTINPNGERCLIQCKHTIDYKSHYNGDDLDKMVSACLRKKCKEAIFITNSDLTPQGKKYVTDEEYSRGLEETGITLKVDYWSGYKIWEKIKVNTDIINKWFSGLGQVHGLRSFKFDLTIQQLPYINTPSSESDSFDKILKVLSDKEWIKEVSPGMHYEANISDDYSVNFKRWFQFMGGLDINYQLPKDDLSFINSPLFALTIEVVMKSGNEIYSPDKIQKQILKKISDEVLFKLEKDKWWHFTNSQTKSFIYLHDISEPREIDLTSAKTYIKVDSNAFDTELDFCKLSETDFEILREDEDDYICTHKASNTCVIQMFEQKINPVEQYNNQLIQLNQINKLKAYNFYAVEKIYSSLIMRVRRLLRHEWFAIQENDDTLIWAIPPDYDNEKVTLSHSKIKALGLSILQKREEEIQYILDNCKKDLVPSSWMYTSKISELSFPVLLNARIFWLSRDLKVTKKQSPEKLVELLKLKYSLEYDYGYDHMNGKKEQQINSKEIMDILFDIMTIRGKRMLDIKTFQNPITVNIRFKEGLLKSSNDLSLDYILEFNKIFNKIEKILS